MKIKVFEEIRVEKEIEIEFPYYFKWDISSDDDITYVYGIVINPEKSIRIMEQKNYLNRGHTRFELEEDIPDASCYGLSSVSSKEEFDAVKKRAIAFLKRI